MKKFIVSIQNVTLNEVKSLERFFAIAQHDRRDIVATGIVMFFMLQAPASALTWIQATANAAWSSRYRHTSIVFDNKMWVLGGTTGGGEVWYSTDGATWTCATTNAAWPARNGHESVVFDNKMWVMGGSGLTNDVWYSTDGATWTQATANASWTGRYYLKSVVFDNKMWVTGGCPGVSGLNDVWYSTDGVTWTCATANAAWGARVDHPMIVFNNKMWFTGGQQPAYSDVWYSTDGVTWTCATASAAWGGLYGHTSVVFDNKMWVMGRQGFFSDVWYSTDGANWTSDGNATWIGRALHTSVVYNNRIWVTGGNSGAGQRNDVWYTGAIAVELVDFSAIGRDGFIELFPSPFKEVVRIEYQVIGHNSKVVDSVSLKIYDGSGQLIRVLIDEPQEPGRRVILWDGRDNQGKLVPNGIYFCSLSTGESKLTRKLIHIE